MDEFPGASVVCIVSEPCTRGSFPPKQVQDIFRWNSLPKDMFQMMFPFYDQ